MRKFSNVLWLAVVLFGCAASKTVTVTASLQAIDSRFDALPDTLSVAIVNKYKPQMDALMNVVIGQTTQAMPEANGAESDICQFTVDAILRFAEQKNIPVDFSLYNVGGLRGGLPQGNVRLYDIFSVYSFDNNVVVLTIQGKYVRELADFFARTVPQPMGNAILKIDGNQVTSLLINNEPLDDERMYRIITNNFVGSGGDNMTMLRNAVSSEHLEVMFRDAIISYIKSLTAIGEKIILPKRN